MSTAAAIQPDTTIYNIVGYMPMPASFVHRALFLAGRPKHERFSDFCRKHPPMDTRHRAKIFAPFDALAGFDDRIAEKEVLYNSRKVLSDEEKEELDRKLSVLHRLTYNGKVARENKPVATVTYYVPCSDIHNDAYGTGGRYVSTTGIVSKVDVVVARTIVVDGMAIPLADVIEIASPVIHIEAV